MKTLKPLFTGIILGLALGLWFGVNIGKDKPLWSNPMAPATIGGVVREKSADIVEQGGKVLERSGQALEQKSESIRDKQ